MPIILLLQLLFLGLLGQAVSLLSSMDDARKLATVSNVPFSYKKFFEKETFTIIKSFIALIIFIMGFDQLAQKWPLLQSFSKWIFPVIGFAGDTLVFRYLGKTNKWLRCIIDEKTNIADGKTYSEQSGS